MCCVSYTVCAVQEEGMGTPLPLAVIAAQVRFAHGRDFNFRTVSSVSSSPKI